MHDISNSLERPDSVTLLIGSLKPSFSPENSRGAQFEVIWNARDNKLVLNCSYEE